MCWNFYMPDYAIFDPQSSQTEGMLHVYGLSRLLWCFSLSRIRFLYKKLAAVQLSLRVNAFVSCFVFVCRLSSMYHNICNLDPYMNLRVLLLAPLHHQTKAESLIMWSDYILQSLRLESVVTFSWFYYEDVSQVIEVMKCSRPNYIKVKKC